MLVFIVSELLGIILFSLAQDDEMDQFLLDTYRSFSFPEHGNL